MTATTTETTWFDVQTIGVEGKGWTETKEYYHRLPAKAEGVVREPVWNLSRQSSGLSVMFETDATEIRARWRLESAELTYPTMPASGASGLDLYARDAAGRWRWAGATRQIRSHEQEDVLAGGIDPGPHVFRIYLPLANVVQSLEIGVPAGATFTPLAPRAEKPLVFYGTSICHGHSASRTGMTHPAILGRRFDLPMINLGFAGSALMEPEVGELLAELDPAVFVIDPIPNMGAELVDERAESFIRNLRAARPSAFLSSSSSISTEVK